MQAIARQFPAYHRVNLRREGRLLNAISEGAGYNGRSAPL